MDSKSFIGKVIGVKKKYKISKKIGSGAFGEIFHAYHIDTKVEYAIKTEPKKSRHS